MRKDHRNNVVGPWAKQKLDALEQYLRAYNVALSKQRFTRVYIDAFAGSPVSRVRGSGVPAPTESFFADLEDASGQEQFIQGSPLRALQIDPGFHRLFFIDQDESRVAALRGLADQYGTDRVKARVGDANLLVRELAKHLHRPNLKGVAFLDPYGAHVEWATLEALASTKNIEVIINFPVAMAINRLIGRTGEVIAEDQISRCFGTDDWKRLSFQERQNLFGEVSLSKNDGVADALLELYLARLERIFGFVATPRLISNTRKQPLYYVIWAGPREIGRRIANHILDQGEKVLRNRG